MHPNAAGALINSALYLTGVFVAGLVTGHPWAWRVALLAMALAFMSHVLQMLPGVSRGWIVAMIAASWSEGALAFFLLYV